jgi:hypothetical protein
MDKTSIISVPQKDVYFARTIHRNAWSYCKSQCSGAVVMHCIQILILPAPYERYIYTRRGIILQCIPRVPSVCPFVRTGSPAPSPQRVRPSLSPRNQRGRGGQHSLGGEGRGEPIRTNGEKAWHCVCCFCSFSRSISFISNRPSCLKRAKMLPQQWHYVDLRFVELNFLCDLQTSNL